MKENKVLWLVVFADGTVLRKNGQALAFTVRSAAEMALLMNGADHLVSF